MRSKSNKPSEIVGKIWRKAAISLKMSPSTIIFQDDWLHLKRRNIPEQLRVYYFK